MAKKRNIIVGQSGGPTSVINSSLAGVYKNAVERGFDKVYGMLHGIQGLLDEQYIDLSTQIHSELDIELLKRTPSAFLGSCRYKLPEIHEDRAIYEKIFDILNKLEIYAFIYIGGNDSMDTIKICLIMPSLPDRPRNSLVFQRPLTMTLRLPIIPQASEAQPSILQPPPRK